MGYFKYYIYVWCYSDLSLLIPLSIKEIEEYNENDKEFIISGIFNECKPLSYFPDICKKEYF